MPRLSRWQRGLMVVLALMACVSISCHAGEVLQAHVERRDGHYLLHLVMRIHAKDSDVYWALLDFKHLPQINDSIKSAKELSHKDGVHRVHIIGEGCVWLICRTIQQEEVVTELANGYLMSVTDPKHSDFQYGRALWHVVDEGKTTRVTYNADLVPAFWIPPLIGPSIFKRRLLREGQKTINGLERHLRTHKP